MVVWSGLSGCGCRLCVRLARVFGVRAVFVLGYVGRLSCPAGRRQGRKPIPVCSGAAAVGCVSREYLALIKYRFTFSGKRVAYYGTGPTRASHDAFDAVGWCRMHWNLDHESGGWTYYRAAGVGRWSRAAAGPSVECQQEPLTNETWWFRVRQAGTRLNFQFALDKHVNESLRYQTALYLTRAS